VSSTIPPVDVSVPVGPSRRKYRPEDTVEVAVVRVAADVGVMISFEMATAAAAVAGDLLPTGAADRCCAVVEMDEDVETVGVQQQTVGNETII
jgi:hypothetical protein